MCNLKWYISLILLMTYSFIIGQEMTKSEWVDSNLAAMSVDEKIGQLYMIRAFSKGDAAEMKNVKRQITKYHVGGVCFFQGHPQTQARLAKEYQDLSKLPLMIGIDGEWGLGMRFKKTAISFPKQLTIGAINDHQLIYRMGKEIGRQCQLSGINVNFAPVVDVNNNPKNPVINFRSFGEDRFDVSSKAYAYMKGMEDADVMACAKHFPGHGDTDVDSHYDLPIIGHDRNRLDSIELFPFKMLIRQGLPSVMVAHLSVPAIDPTVNRPTSLSKSAIIDLLRKEMGFTGLVFTDAMDMKGVTKHFAPGAADVAAILAGNDIILIPEEINASIKKMRDAITDGSITIERLDESVRRVLGAKYDMSLHQIRTLAAPNKVLAELNSKEAAVIKSKIYERAITLVKNDQDILPLKVLANVSFGSISLGSNQMNKFQQRLLYYADVDNTFLPKDSPKKEYDFKVKQISKHDVVFVTLEDMSRYASRNFGINENQISFIKELAKKTKVLLTIFGSPYALEYFEDIPNVILAYEEDEMAQDAAAQAIMGAIDITGKLPVSASPNYPLGTGIKIPSLSRMGFSIPEAVGMNSDTLKNIQKLVDELISTEAAPGCQVLVAKNNKVIYHKAFGHHTYNKKRKVTKWDIYDLASVTKVLASTVSAMHLQDEGKFDLKKPIREYIAEEDTTNKADIIYEDILAHVAGLAGWIPFYITTVEGEKKKKPSPDYYRSAPTDSFDIVVTPHLFLRHDYPDTIWRKIFSSKLRDNTDYRYSDLAFYIMNRTVKNITGYEVDGYAERNFYNPMGLRRTMFSPYRILADKDIVPSEHDEYWRNEVVDGTVHDMGAAMLGGVSGHAGLFSNALEVGIMMQMMLNGGHYGGRNYIESKTVDYYTKRHWRSSRRGIGWDMKELNPDRTLNMSEKASRRAFGHLGFTGTATFVDPDHDIVFVFLSNRTYPTMRNNKLGKNDYRPKIQSVIYDAIMVE